MQVYQEYFTGELEHVEYSQSAVDAAMAQVPTVER